MSDMKRSREDMLPTPAATTTRTKRIKNSHGSSTTPWSMTTVPEDILVEIFARLPAKSVGRFRCLSSSWAATLTSPPFVDLHLHLANHQLQVPKLFFTNWPVQNLTKPCHGLVLQRRPPHNGQYYVCNPSTGELLRLPDSEKCERRSGGVSYGLGYNPATMEHKVVRLFSYHSTSCCECEVLTLDVSAHWRVVAQRPPPCAVRSPAVFCDGYLHFLHQQQAGGTRSIITFDVGGETFGSLTVHPAAQDDDGPIELTVLDGCLCLCVFHDRRPRSDIDPYCIWRLTSRELAGGQWEKLYRVLQPQTTKPELDLLRLRWVTPLEIYRTGNRNKKIMFATEEGVLAFDLHGGGVPEMLVAPAESTTTGNVISSGTVGLLEESLVPVGRTSEHIIFSSPWRKAWSDILKWMPAQSVVASMCVCKEWHAVIKSDRFTQMHAFHANLGKSLQIRLVHPFLNVFYPLEFLRRVQHEMMHFLFPNGSSRIVCSKPCHGLVLASYMDNSSCIDYLCNLSREYSRYIFLDKGVVKHDAGNSSLSAGRIGLGYDLRTNKHVLVRLVVCCTKSSRDYQLKCFVQHTDSKSWISISPPPRPVADLQPSYADGKLYWMVDHKLGTKSSAARCELMALDVGTLEFEVLPGPPCNSDQITSIIEFQGNICILSSDRRANSIDVWTLKGGFWSTGYRIELRESQQMYPSHETTLLAVDPKDDRILLSTGRALGYYDPKTRALETIYYLGEHLRGMEFAPALCYESLIRPRT